MYNIGFSQETIRDYLQENSVNDNLGRTVFNLVGDNERLQNKYIYEFTEDELIKFYGNNKTLKTLRLYNNLIKDYIDWCIDRGYVYNNINNAKKISKNIKSLAKDDEFDFIPENKIEELISYMYNPIDKFIIYATYSGIKGNMCVELALLRPEHIDFKNLKMELSNLDKDGRPYIKRSVNVSRRLANYADQAIRTKKYVTASNVEVEVMGWVVKFKRKENYNIEEMDPLVYIKDMRALIGSKFKLWKRFSGFEEISTKQVYFSGLYNKIVDIASSEKLSGEEILKNVKIKEILRDYDYIPAQWFKTEINKLDFKKEVSVQ